MTEMPFGANPCSLKTATPCRNADINDEYFGSHFWCYFMSTNNMAQCEAINQNLTPNTSIYNHYDLTKDISIVYNMLFIYNNLSLCVTRQKEAMNSRFSNYEYKIAVFGSSLKQRHCCEGVLTRNIAKSKCQKKHR